MPVFLPSIMQGTDVFEISTGYSGITFMLFLRLTTGTSVQDLEIGRDPSLPCSSDLPFAHPIGRKKIFQLVNTIVIIRGPVPTQPPIQCASGAPSPGVKRMVYDDDHSPPPNAEVINAWSYTSTLQCVFTAWCLVKHRENFTCKKWRFIQGLGGDISRKDKT
jgi:hypothetical protein